jgi:hypothetical protein
MCYVISNIRDVNIIAIVLKQNLVLIESFNFEPPIIEGRLASGYAPDRMHACAGSRFSQLTDARGSRELMLPSNIHNASALLLPTLQLANNYTSYCRTLEYS